MKKKIQFKQRIIKKDEVKEKAKTDLINNSLIEIRKYYLKNIDDNAKLKFKLLHFNKVMRSKSALSNKEFLDTFIKLDEWGFNEKK